MRRLLACLLWCVLLPPGSPVRSADLWPTGRESVAPAARPFPLSQVRLLAGPFQEAQQRDRKYLRELDSDRLLYFFRQMAGLPTAGKPLGGWEGTEVRGHTLGHFLSASAQMAASTGDAVLKAKVETMVAELARCQAAHGDGYLAAFPRSFIDRAVERKPVWAPFYTLHKLLAGLLDVHVYCENQQSLEVAHNLADWLERRLAPLDRETFQAMLNTTEQGGMNEALANLYGLTGERRWLDFSRRFNQDRYVQPLARQEDRLRGEHVNSFIPNIVGTARQFELAGDPTDRRIAKFFWDQVTTTRCYCTGGTSNHEHWRTDPNQLATELGDHTQETCCTYNLLKLTRHLFAWQPDRRYADYYERALWNSILATQDPKTGMMMYFVALGPGRWKYFNTPLDSFWCCTGTGLENHARYGESIYFHDSDGVWVNQFIASELRWPEKGLTLRQESEFPHTPATSLRIAAEREVQATLRIRRPAWAGPGYAVRVNGQVVDEPANSAGYVILDRKWCDGDRVDVDLPLRLSAAPLPGDPHRLAVMLGPFVLAGRLGSAGLTPEVQYTTENWFRFPARLLAPAPDIVTAERDPARWLKPVPGRPLEFRTDGVGRPADVTLVPYHRLWGERYCVYWRVVSEAQWQQLESERQAREAAQQALLQRLIDRVEIGDAQSEREHKLAGTNLAAGPHLDRHWRHAGDGGWFSYELQVLPDQPATLRCTYWGSEVGNRTFDILVDGRKLATQSLHQNRPDAFFEVDYAIPADWTAGRQTVTIRFQARPGHIAGGLFGLWLLRPAK